MTTARRSSRVARALAITVPAICATVALAASSALGAPTTTLTTCDEASLKAAVARGGTVQYGVDCTVTLTSPVIVGSGLTVDVEAGGFRVFLNGGHTARHFVVSGGNLTVGGLELQSGLAVGATGTPGSFGASGAKGGDGASGSSGDAGGSGGIAGAGNRGRGRRGWVDPDQFWNGHAERSDVVK